MCENIVFIEGPSVYLILGKSPGHERQGVSVFTSYKESIVLNKVGIHILVLNE